MYNEISYHLMQSANEDENCFSSTSSIHISEITPVDWLEIRRWYSFKPHEVPVLSVCFQKHVYYICALSFQVTTRQQWTDTKAWQTQDINNTNDPQKKYRLETVSKNI